MQTSDEFFYYHISKNQSFLVATLTGKLQQSSLDHFSQFQQEVLSVDALKVVLLDFSNVSAMTLDAVPAFVIFQKTMRSRGLEIRLCGMDENLKEKLSKLGVVRSTELASTLRAAVESVLESSHVKAS